MASASYTVKEFDDTTDVVLTLVGNTATGAVYRNSDRPLSLPQELEFSINIGAPGSKANDKVTLNHKNVVLNATTGQVSTGSVKVELSIPRDSDAWSDTDTKDLLAIMCQHLCTDARIISLADGLVP